MDLQQQFGSIDIHLFDQLLRGRLRPGMAVLDAGCGGGRNLVFLLRQGFDVRGVDADPRAVDAVRTLAAELAPHLVDDRFVAAPVEAMPFPDASFDFVICNAVLHFARDDAHFRAMVADIARVLRPGGLFFARLMGTVGVEHLARPLGGGRFLMPGGVEAFLANEALLHRLTTDVFRGRLADPLKSTVVHGQRTMMTWVVQKDSG